MLRTQNSNANHNNEMTQDEEISAQKLCAGTVSGATPKAGGLYTGYPVDTPRLAKLLVLLLYFRCIINTAAHKRNYTVLSLYLYR